MKKDKVIKLGSKIRVGDAAFYDNDNSIMSIEIKVKSGYYIAWTEEEDFGMFDKGVSKLSAFHNKFLKRLDKGNTKFYWEHMGNFGVDTAKASIYT